MKLYCTIIVLLVSLQLQSQDAMNDSLPYATIPEAPDTYTPGTVIARMIDGLGFRYRWATENLTQENLNFEPGNEGRTIAQTLDHLYGLSNVILNSAKKHPTDFTIASEEFSQEQKRRATLENFKIASELFAKTEDLNEHPVIFKRANGESEFPFWNNINGPIEDAIWHAGQIVVLRRTAGNPINPKVNVFLGKLNE